MSMQFGQGVRDFLVEANRDLDIRAGYVSDEEARSNYLARGFGNSYDFSQAP